VSKLIVDSYRSAYSNPSTGDPATTLSACDLSTLRNTATAITSLSDTLIAKLDTNLQAIIEARAATQTYAPGFSFHHVDLTEFLNQLTSRVTDQQIKDQAQLITRLISIGVVANYAGAERQHSYGSRGLAIYFPASEQEYVRDPF